MNDTALFMEWAMETLEHEFPVDVVVDGCGGGEATATFPSLQALRDVSHAGLVFPELVAEAHAANSGSSGETDCSGAGANFSSPPAPAMEHDVWLPSPNSARCAPTPVTSSLPVLSWNFSAASAELGSGGALDAAAGARPYEPGVPEIVYGSQPTRRSAARSAAITGPASAPYAQDHIIAERKRREKINKRFIELSTVIPGLKKMDKATILCDATRHVKELQEKIKALEAGGGGGGGNGRSIVETVVLVKKPSYGAVPSPDENGSPSSASSLAPPPTASRSPLPEIEVRFTENSVIVRIICDDAKGVVVRVLSEAEGLHLGITHTNVMPFTACTLIITITAKVEEGFTVTAEEIIGSLNSALQRHSSCSSTEETAN